MLLNSSMLQACAAQGKGLDSYAAEQLDASGMCGAG